MTHASIGTRRAEISRPQATNTGARRGAMLWGYVGDLLADDGAEASGRLEVVEDDNGERAFPSPCVPR
jgi:hypothetical protein